MEHTTTYISSHDGQKIFLRIWNQVEKPKGIVQIIHGMAEHSARYETFALFLNKKVILFMQMIIGVMGIL
jgi:Lysophospholipase